MLTRTLLLVLCLCLSAEAINAQQRVLDPAKPTVKAHGEQWAVAGGRLWSVDTATREMTPFRTLRFIDYSTYEGTRIPLFTKDRYPQMVRYTSENSSLVPGDIVHLSCQPNGTLWAINRAGRICSFDGDHWEILEPLCADSNENHRCFRGAVVRENTMRVITCSGIASVDMKTYKTEALRTVPTWNYHSVRFASWDSVRMDGWLKGTIDLGRGVDDIDDSEFIAMWDSVDAGSLNVSLLHMMDVLELRNALKPSVPWVRSDTLEERYFGYGCCLSGCVVDVVESVYSIAVDASGTLHLGTDLGIVVLPDPNNSLLNEEEVVMTSVLLAPNPAAHTTRLELGADPVDETLCRIVDITGRSVYLEWLRERVTHIDVSALPVGMYYVTITSPHRRSVLPLRVAH